MLATGATDITGWYASGFGYFDSIQSRYSRGGIFIWPLDTKPQLMVTSAGR
jgi:hypothetical protein